jgi:hypothetical protein
MTMTMTDQLVRITTKGMLRALGDVQVGRRLRQSPSAGARQSRLLAALRQSPGALRWKELVEYVYGDDPDGGPLWAPRTITVAVHRLRKSGHKILSGRPGPLGLGSTGGYEMRD